jgi:transposase|tara:strand:+ start:56 stop:322 length:267 start_codon:yes stop_codon:yes gene_type:complete
MKRKKWLNETKFKIVIEGMQGHVTVSELCNRYEIHQSQYYQWRDQFLKEGAKVFESSGSNKREEQLKKKMRKMERVIGELTLELKKND